MYWVQLLTTTLLDPAMPDVSFTREETGTHNKLSASLRYTQVTEVELDVYLWLLLNLKS